MTDFSDLLSPDALDADLMATSKKGLFQQLGSAAGRLIGIDAKDVVASIAAREKTGTTGFGGGIAIPHGKLPAVARIHGYFARLATPLQYQAVDLMPVDLVFLLLSPPDAGADHLKALARVSRALRDKQFLAKLRGARSRDALYAVLSGAETRDAA
jgi:PTS system nitrogen regulatory IIA component